MRSGSGGGRGRGRGGAAVRRPPRKLAGHKDVKAIKMATVSAVMDGAKTKLMKEMKRRDDGFKDSPNLVQKVLPGLFQPKELEVSNAFSILSAERALDFVAPDRETRDAWLTNLNLLLVNRATQDTHKVMTRGDVAEELRTMSFAIAALRQRKVTAVHRQRQATQSRLSLIRSMREEEEAAEMEEANGGGGGAGLRGTLGMVPSERMSTTQRVVHEHL